MKLNNRQLLIYATIKEQGFCHVHSLSQLLHFSPATIRRDLAILQDVNMVFRTNGGAMLPQGRDAEIPLLVREETNKPTKQQIAKKACEFVNDGDSIILDSSTTAACMVPYLLKKSNLTIITNGAKTAIDLSSSHGFNVICTGGTLRENSLSYIGLHAQQTLMGLYADKLFFSARAADPVYGITEISDQEALLRQTMLKRCAKSFFLAESSKLNNVALHTVCPMQNIDLIITDPNFNKTLWQEFNLCTISDQLQ